MNSTVVDKLRTAVRHHQNGDIPSAARLYADILSEDPNNADAWHLSGLAAYGTGNSVDAESLIRRAIELNSSAPEFKANLAAVIVNQARGAEAEELCRTVLRIDPRHADALAPDVTESAQYDGERRCPHCETLLLCVSATEKSSWCDVMRSSFRPGWYDDG